MMTEGFEPSPLRTSALSWRLRPLGHITSVVVSMASDVQKHPEEVTINLRQDIGIIKHVQDIYSSSFSISSSACTAIASQVCLSMILVVHFVSAERTDSSISYFLSRISSWAFSNTLAILGKASYTVSSLYFPFSISFLTSCLPRPLEHPQY